ncbi:protein of unknown function [Porphyromonadaceae bacterium KH3CP3RA]|nr:protein of unknown function [Porphyromonadaceae bacterium KH3CP3RA]
MKNYSITIYMLLILLVSCKQNESDDLTLKPKPVLNAKFEPNMGGGIISYDLPDDESIHFVKAVYTLKAGQTIERASSYFSTSIEIDGYDDTSEHEVKLYSVNYDGILSDPVLLKIKTLGSPLDDIVESFNITPYFSSAKLTWENEAGAWVQIIIEIETKDRTVIQTEYTMNTGNNEMVIKNLSAENYHFKGYVKDKYGNESKKVDIGSFIPYVDYKIDKSDWNYVPNHELPEGRVNSDLIFQEGRLTKFWDDMIDDALLNNLNFFVSAQGFPFSYYIDLGRMVKISRFKVWQREKVWSMPHYYYNGQNLKTFELWISKDKINWERVRRATIIKPMSETAALEEAREGHEFVIYPDDPKFSPEFRYLEFRGIESFGIEDQYACLSEITLFGIEKKDF